MKASDRLRSAVGSNIAESMGRGNGVSAVPFQAPRADSQERFSGINRVKGAFQIPTGRITPDPNQPRKEFDEEAVDRLAKSLKERGQLQAIRVRWDAEADTWVIIAGERRWRAAVRAGLATVAAVEATGEMSLGEILEDQLVENCLRADLKPIEQATAFKALMDSQGWTYDQLGEHLNVTKSAVSQAVRLLNLPDEVQAQVEQGKLAPSVAYEVGKLDGPDAQVEMARRVVAEDMSRAEVVKAVKGRASAKPKGRGVAKPSKIRARTFRKVAGCTVTVECAKGTDAAGMRAALLATVAVLDAESGIA